MHRITDHNRNDVRSVINDWQTQTFETHFKHFRLLLVLVTQVLRSLEIFDRRRRTCCHCWRQ